MVWSEKLVLKPVRFEIDIDPFGFGSNIIGFNLFCLFLL